jgi:hypothetical protein
MGRGADHICSTDYQKIMMKQKGACLMAKA